MEHTNISHDIFNEKERTICGVAFHDTETFDTFSEALSENIKTGFHPTYQNVSLIKEAFENNYSAIELLIHLKKMAEEKTAPVLV